MSYKGDMRLNIPHLSKSDKASETKAPFEE